VPSALNSELPAVTNLKTMASSDEVGLEWSSFADAENVQGFAIYRLDMAGNREQIGSIGNRYATHFVDTGLESGQTYRYMVKTIGNGGVSNDGTIATANTTKQISSISFAKAMTLPSAVKLIWRPHPDMRVNGYIIERANAGSSSFSTVAKLDGRLNAEYIDNSVRSGAAYDYRIIVRTITGEKSAPSDKISTLE